MTELVKQLEDKKKGCGCITAGNEEFGTMNCGDIWGKWDEDKWIDDKKPTYCDKCQAEIAILEQAISEIKSNNEIIEKIRKELCDCSEGFEKCSCCRGIDYILSQQNKIKSNSNSQDLYFIFFTEQKKTGSADISNLLQKQRQEILDKIVNYNQNKLRWLWNDGEIFIALSSIKQQLNQPKEDAER